MSITTTAQDALTALMTAHPDLVVSVRHGNQTGNGIVVLTDKQTDPTELGQEGTTVGTIRISAATFTEPERGAKIIVDAKQVYITGSTTSGGIRRIEYSNTQPVEGI